MITNHAKDRLKERQGLSKTAAVKTAALAWEHGHRSASYTGSFRRYLDKLPRQGSVPVVYNLHIWIFNTTGTLITSHPVPQKYRNHKAKDHDHRTKTN